MAVYTDNFDSYANAYSLADSANWDLIAGSISVYKPAADGEAHCSDANISGVFQTGTYDAAQYAEAVVAAIGGGVIGVSVRCSSTNGYFYFSDSSQAYVGKLVAGTDTIWNDSTGAVEVGDVMRIEITGTSITCKLNGATVYTTTDSSLSTGKPGIMGANNETTSRIDSWEGGNLEAPGAISGIISDNDTATGTLTGAGALSGTISDSDTVTGTLINSTPVGIYNLKYRSIFYNIYGKEIIVQIYKLNWAGSVEEIRTQSAKIQTNYQDRTTPIIGTGATIVVINTGVFDALEDLLISQEKEFRCDITWGGYNVFSGYSLCDINDSQLLPRASITLQFVDYLRRLEIPTIEDLDLTLVPIMNIWDIFIAVMVYIDLNEFNIYVHSSLLEDRMDATVCLTQLYTEIDLFKDSSNKYDSIYEMLNKIFFPLGFHVYQFGGIWILERIDDIGSDDNWYSANFIAGSWSWVPLETGLTQTYNKQLDFDYVEESQKLDYVSGTKTLLISVEDKKKDSIVYNNFTDVIPIEETIGDMLLNTWYRGTDTSDIKTGLLKINKINTFVQWASQDPETPLSAWSIYRLLFEAYVDNLFAPIDYNTNDNDVSKLLVAFMKETPYQITENGLAYKFDIYGKLGLGQRTLNIKFKIAPLFTAAEDANWAESPYFLSKAYNFIVAFQIQAVSDANGHGGEYIVSTFPYEDEPEREVTDWAVNPDSFVIEFDGARRNAELSGPAIFEVNRDITIPGPPSHNQDFVIKFSPVVYTTKNETYSYVYTISSSTAIGDIQVTVNSPDIENEFAYKLNDNFIKTDEVKLPLCDFADLMYSNGFYIQPTIGTYLRTETWQDAKSDISDASAIEIPLIDMFAKSWYSRYSRTNRALKATIQCDEHLKLFSIITDDNLQESAQNIKFILLNYTWDLNTSQYEIETEEYPETDVIISEES